SNKTKHSRFEVDQRRLIALEHWQTRSKDNDHFAVCSPVVLPEGGTREECLEEYDRRAPSSPEQLNSWSIRRIPSTQSNSVPAARTTLSGCPAERHLRDELTNRHASGGALQRQSDRAPTWKCSCGFGMFRPFSSIRRHV